MPVVAGVRALASDLCLMDGVSCFMGYFIGGV